MCDPAEDKEIPQLPRPPSKRWVTFDDLLEDALESGKLTPRRKGSVDDDFRRYSVSSVSAKSAVMSSSISSTESFINSHKPLDFSASLGSGVPTNVNSRSIATSMSSDAIVVGDKYSEAFEGLRSRQDALGWSRDLVQGRGQNVSFGWSEEILRPKKPNHDRGVLQRPETLHLDLDESKAWMKALLSSTSTWEKSPNRVFARNFP